MNYHYMLKNRGKKSNISEAKRRAQKMEECISTPKLFKRNRTDVDITTTFLETPRKDLQPRLDGLTAAQTALTAPVEANKADKDALRRTSNKVVTAMMNLKDALELHNGQISERAGEMARALGPEGPHISLDWPNDSKILIHTGVVVVGGATTW